MSKKYLLGICIFLCCSLHTLAQSESTGSLYMFNSLAYNPAYAGYKGDLNLNATYRDQWTGVKEAPVSQYLFADAAFFNEDRVGLGLGIVNDKAGLQNYSSIYTNYSYRLPIGYWDARLAFGVALGVEQYTLNTDKYNGDPSIVDPKLSGGIRSTLTPDARFGVYYSDERFYGGLSVVNLFSNSVDLNFVSNGAVAKSGRNFFLTGGGIFDINQDMNIKLKPSFIIRENFNTPTNIDLNVFGVLQDMYSLGVSYRTGTYIGKKLTGVPAFQQNAIVGAMQLYLLDGQLRIGYAYDYSLSKVGAYIGGSHEISIGGKIRIKPLQRAVASPRLFE